MLRLLLCPFSLLYGLVVYIRNMLFDYGLLKSKSFFIPIISVGNITVGGTGKTPHVEYIVNLLNDKFRVSVLSRGYKRKTKGFVVAEDKPTTASIGDEAVQIKLKYPNVEVAVDAKRVRGAKKLIERNNEIIILDDAYQHRYIESGLSILLIDYNRPIEKDYIIPCGHLREHQRGTNRADIIIFTKTPENIKPIDKRVLLERLQPYPYQTVYFSCIKYANFVSVFGNNVNVPDDFSNNHEVYTILLFSGIANTKTLVAHLKKYTLDIIQIKFSDHANYTKSRLNKIVNTYKSIENEKKIIVTTEKDSVKLREIGNADDLLVNNTFYIPIKIDIINDKSTFNKQILEYVNKN